MLTVSPARQSRQLGRTILAAAEAIAADRGARRMRMTVVNLRDTLIAWYQRRGYALTGETEPFPYDDRRFGTPTRPGPFHRPGKAPDLNCLAGQAHFIPLSPHGKVGQGT
jgi:hypothetical protein